jgi:hypothetical protein
VFQSLSDTGASPSRADRSEILPNERFAAVRPVDARSPAPWPGRIAGLRVAAPLLAVLVASSCKKPEAVVPPPPIVEVMEITTSEVPLSATLIGQLD